MSSFTADSYSQHQDLLTRTTTTHTTYDQSLSSFAPEILKHILSQEKKIKVPYRKQFEAVGFFADVSGFTKATESLSNAMGDLGTEILAHKINAYLPHIGTYTVCVCKDIITNNHPPTQHNNTQQKRLSALVAM